MEKKNIHERKILSSTFIQSVNKFNNIQVRQLEWRATFA